MTEYFKLQFQTIYIYSLFQEVANTQLQQDGSDTKQDDVNLSQNVQGTQEVLITLQVPAGLQHLQPQLVTDPTFGLQHVQLVQPVSGQEAQTVRHFEVLVSFRCVLFSWPKKT